MLGLVISFGTSIDACKRSKHLILRFYAIDASLAHHNDGGSMRRHENPSIVDLMTETAGRSTHSADTQNRDGIHWKPLHRTTTCLKKQIGRSKNEILGRPTKILQRTYVRGFGVDDLSYQGAIGSGR
jgi:hypothetical protein